MDLKRRFYVKASWWEKPTPTETSSKRKTTPVISNRPTVVFNEEDWVKDKVYYEEPMIREINPRFVWDSIQGGNRFDWHQPINWSHLFLPFNCTFIKYSLECASAKRAGLSDISWEYHPQMGAARLQNTLYWSNQKNNNLANASDKKLLKYFGQNFSYWAGKTISGGRASRPDNSLRAWDMFALEAYSWEGDNYVAKYADHDFLSGPHQMIRLTDAWPYEFWDNWRYGHPNRKAVSYGEKYGLVEMTRENVTTKKTGDHPQGFHGYPNHAAPPSSPYFLADQPTAVTSGGFGEPVPLNYGYFIGNYADPAYSPGGNNIVVRFQWIRGIPAGDSNINNRNWQIGEPFQQAIDSLPWWNSVTHSNGTTFKGRHIRVRFYKTDGEHLHRQTAPSDDYLIDTHYYPLDYDFHKGSPVVVYDVKKNDYISAFVDFDWPIPEGINESAINKALYSVAGPSQQWKSSADLARRAPLHVSGACYWGGLEVFIPPESGSGYRAGESSSGGSEIIATPQAAKDIGEWVQVQQPYIKSNGDWKKAESVYKKKNNSWELVHSDKVIPAFIKFPANVPLSEDKNREDGNFQYIDVDLKAYSLDPTQYGAPRTFVSYSDDILTNTPMEITVIVEPGAKILNLRIHSFHPSTRIIIRNYGEIRGRGGAGGDQLPPHNLANHKGLVHFSQLNGHPGASAITTDHSIVIQNFGKIYGGGGGGHAGMPSFSMDLSGQLFYDRGAKFLAGQSHTYHGASYSLPGYWKPCNTNILSNGGGIFHSSFTRGWISEGRPTSHGPSYTIPASGYYTYQLVSVPRYQGYYGQSIYGYRYVYSVYVSRRVWRQTSPARTVRPETKAIEAGNLDIPVLEQAVFWNVCHGAPGGGGAPFGGFAAQHIKADGSQGKIYNDKDELLLQGLGTRWGMLLSRIIWDHNFDAYDKDPISQFDFTSFIGMSSGGVGISYPYGYGGVDKTFGDGTGNDGKATAVISDKGKLTGVLKNRAVWTPSSDFYSLSNPQHLRHGNGAYWEVAGMTTAFLKSNRKNWAEEVLNVKGVTVISPHPEDKVTGIDPWEVEIKTPLLFGGSAYSSLGNSTPLVSFESIETLYPSSKGGMDNPGDGPELRVNGSNTKPGHDRPENERYRYWPGGRWKKLLGDKYVLNCEDFPARRETNKDRWNKGVKAWLDGWKTSGGKGGAPGEAGESFTLERAVVYRFGQKIVLPSITIEGGEPGKAVDGQKGASVLIQFEGTMKGSDV